MKGRLVLGLSVVLAILASVQSYDFDEVELRNSSTPYSSDISIAFYEEAHDLYYGLTRGNNQDLCLSHLDKIYKGIKDYQEWALQWPDSWGRLPMGLMWGHTISMGGFEECIESTRKFTETDTVNGKYCLARIPIAGFMKQVKPVKPAESRKISYMQATPTVFELGMCIPKSCDPAFANDVLKNALRKHFKATIKDSTVMVFEDFCRTNDPLPLRGIDIFAIVFFSTIVLFMIASSIYDMQMRKTGQKGKPLFMAFSVVTNAKKVFNTVDNSKNPNAIECLNGLRTISMMWVVFGHGYMTFYELPHINRNKFYEWIYTPWSMLVQNGSLCVDTFFFMSGLLMLWGAFREMEKTKGKLNIPMMYFHRYIRLTPVVAVVILYTMSLYKHTGAGPMWFKLGTQDKRCTGTWWANFLYIQNYVYPYQICVSQSWYLAVDTQLYFISPLFLIPLWKWGKKALIPISIFGLLCVGCTFATFLYNDFTLFRVQDNQVDLRQRLTYYPTHTRIPTWLVGMIFGYFFFKYNRGRKIALSKPYVILGWCVAFSTMIVDLWGPFWRIMPKYPDATLIEGAFFEPLSRLSWALSIGWIVWACYNGHGGLINDFLCWGFFQVFARLSYCMYVIHRIVQLVTAARLQTDTHFSNYDLILRWWHDFGITLTLSIFATLAFESPILGIEKAIFGHGEAPKKKPVAEEVSTDVKTPESVQPVSTEATK